MKALVLIMSANCQPALRNEETIFNTYVKSYNDNKDLFSTEFIFIAYKGNYNEVKLNNNVLQLTSPDDIKNTFNKTLEAFEYIRNIDFDYLIRVNISTYVNLFLLDKELQNFDKNKIYCNAVCTYYNSNILKNEVFARGDAYIIHKKLLFNILKCNDIDNLIDKGVDNTDDSMFGVLCSKYFNNKTHNNIVLLNYSFIPHMIQYINSYDIKKSACIIFTRLKTCPPYTHSGYSWDDNEYRLHDVYKFKYINNYIFNVKNKNSNIIYDDNNKRAFLANVDNKLYEVKFSDIIKMNNQH